jgi:hypothetical protein
MSQYPNQFNNNLLSGYQNFQKSNVPFQNNPLLRNNPRFQNSINYNSQQMQQMQNMQKAQMMNMYQQMMKLKQLQQMKQLEKINDIDKLISEDRIKESVIKPIKIERDNQKDFEDKANKLVSEFDAKRQEHWSTRTNQPYKVILTKGQLDDTGQKYIKSFNKKEDLIVHKYTKKDTVETMDNFKALVDILNKHNNELKIMYSASEEAKNLEKFEYNNKYKFRIKYDPADFETLKKDQISYYKKEQFKLEKDKKRVDDIIDSLMSTGIFSNDEIKQLEEEEKEGDKVDVANDMEKQLRDELGDDYDNVVKQAEAELKAEQKEVTPEPETNEDSCSDDSSDKKTRKRVTIKSRPKKTSDNIDTNINDDVRDKYKQRQKKK